MSNPDQLRGTIAKGPLHAIHASPAVRDALLAYHDRPADDEAAAVVAAISAALATTEPMFWVRLRSDSGYEGPIHNDGIERVRKESGGWTPLYPHIAPTEAAAMAATVPASHVLVPRRLTREMEEVFEEEGWQWANFLEVVGDLPPDLPEDIDAIVACLGDDAAMLRDEMDNPEDERAANMDAAAALIERLAQQAPVADQPAEPSPADPIRGLLQAHEDLIEQGENYAYFELAYTRQTGWMAWLTDRPARGEPGTAEYAKSRKVIARGQGDSAEEACQDALNVMAAPKGDSNG